MKPRVLRTLLTLAALLAGPTVGDAAFLRHFAGGGAAGGGGGGTALALTRVFNNPTGSPTGSTAFWMIGQPFKNTFSDPSGLEITADEVPSGNIVTCALGGQAGDSQGSATSVPCSLVGRKLAQDGSVEWGQLLVDFSGLSIPAGGKDTLVLTSTPGTFCDAQGTGTCVSGFTNSSWTGLHDVVTLSSLSFGPPPMHGFCNGAGSLATNTAYNIVITYTNAGGESVPSQSYQFNNTASGNCSTGTTQFAVSPPSPGPSSLGMTGWNVYACQGANCNNYQLQAQITGFNLNYNFTSFATGGASPPATPGTLGPIAASVVGSGAWNAKFDGGPTNYGDNGTETVLADSPQGRESKVAAYLWDTTRITATATGTTTLTITTSGSGGNPNTLVGNDAVVLFNSGGTQLGICTAASITSGTVFTCSNANSATAGSVASIAPINRNMRVVMYYWATCKASGNTCNTAGPVWSLGPFIENDLIYPKASSPYYANSTLSAYVYTPKLTRNGTDIRGGSAAGGAGYTGIVTPWLAIGNMTRLDGQGDWTANDPGIWVSQDYGKVVDTRKIPPFTKGLTYVGATTGCSSQSGQCLFYQANIASNTSTIFTSTGSAVTDSMRGIFGNQYSVDGVVVQPVELGGTLGTCTPACAAGHLYWAVSAKVPGAGPNQQFCLYDNFYDAQLGGSCSNPTGQFTLSGTWTGATVQMAEAPGSLGQLDVNVSAVSTRSDLGLVTEWGAAYAAGNTQQWQRMGRLLAYDVDTFQTQAIDNNSADAGYGHIISRTNTAITGMSKYLNTTYFMTGGLSADINSGLNPPGGNGGWVVGASPFQHTFNPEMIPWILEGNPFFRDLEVINGHELLAGDSLAARTQMLVSGTTYYGTQACAFQNGAHRRGAWSFRNILYGAFAALPGSPEETYYRTLVNDNMAECAAYASYEGSGYSNLGLTQYIETTWPIAGATASSNYTETFMQNFMALVFNYGAMLDGDWSPSVLTEATYIDTNWLANIYGGNNSCPYYATAYIKYPGLFDSGDSPPFSYPASWADAGLMPDQNEAAFDGTSTISTTVAHPTAFVGNANWRVFFNSEGGIGEFNKAPTPIPGDNTYYWATNVSWGASTTFNIANTQNGSTLTLDGFPATGASWASTNGGQITFNITGAIANSTAFTTTGFTPSGYNGTWTALAGGSSPIVTSVTNPGTATVLGKVYPHSVGLAWVAPHASVECPSPGDEGSGNTIAGDSYWSEQLGSTAMMAALNITGGATVYNTAKAMHIPGANAPDFSQTLQWGLAPP